VPTDFNMDVEGPLLVSHLPGIELRMQKITFSHGSDLCRSDSFTTDPLAVQRAAGGLMPAGYLSVLGLGCTSMSFTLGPQRVDEEIHKVHPNTKTTDMARSQAKAAKALGMKRVGLVTPYIDSVHANNVKMLESAGLTVSRSVNLALIKSEYSSQVDLETLVRATQQVDGPEVDGVIIGCSAFRVCLPGRIDTLEKAIGGKPVVTSTQAFYWNLLRTAGIDDQLSGYGQLHQKH
jgi:maleate isomerase